MIHCMTDSDSAVHTKTPSDIIKRVGGLWIVLDYTNLLYKKSFDIKIEKNITNFSLLNDMVLDE